MRIVIAGAGSIGCFVGGCLVLGGHEVHLMGRPRILDDLIAHGLHLTDFEGLDRRIPPSGFVCHVDPTALSQAELIIVCVKTQATQDMAAAIAHHAPLLTPVISLQNGLAAARILRSALPDRDIRAGMVAFNVVPMGQGRYHKATSGEIVLDHGSDPFGPVLSSEFLEVLDSDRIVAVQWGKLVRNLVNAPNALSGLPIRDMLLDRAWRRVISAQMAEALAVLHRARQDFDLGLPVSPRVLPHILRLATPLYRRIAARMLTIDPEARSSMAYDLMAGRRTEIDALQGEIIALGQSHGVPTPVSARLTELVRAAEKAGPDYRHLAPEECRVQGVAR